MFYYPQLRLSVFTALTLSIVPSLRGEPVSQASHTPPAFSMQDVISDLAKRHNRLAEEFAKSAREPAKQFKKTSDQGNVENMRTCSEIAQCLAARGSYLSHLDVPTDPLYAALKKQRLADSDLKTATVWWQYCKEASVCRSLKSFDDWPLTIQLKFEKAKADAEYAALSLKPEVAKSDSQTTGINLDSSITARWPTARKSAVSVLDRIEGWEKLSAEEKSKIIIR